MPVGGAEDFALGVFPHLAPEVDARFVCLRELGMLGEEALAAGWPVELLPVFRSKRVSLIGIWRLASWIKREGIQLVHSQTHHAHIYGVLAARIAGIPCIVHQQKTLDQTTSRKSWILGLCLRHATAVVALSQQTATDIQTRHRVPENRLHVIPNAIDTEMFRPVCNRKALREELGLPNDNTLFGTVASLHPVKNHETIIRALALLDPSSRPEFVFVGDGVARSHLENLASNCGVKIRFVGRQRPVAPWFQALDLFVLASHWEGQPLALLQAISCGLPVVASRIEGNTAVLGDSHAGLFDPKEPRSLARLMEQPLTDFGTSHASVPSCRDASEQLKNLYRSLI